MHYSSTYIKYNSSKYSKSSQRVTLKKMIQYYNEILSMYTYYLVKSLFSGLLTQYTITFVPFFDVLA